MARKPLGLPFFAQAKLFIESDIFREVQWAKADDNEETKRLLRQAGITIGGAGNLLCPLALFCYTEWAGHAMLDDEGKSHKDGEAFHAFLDFMEGGYKRLVAQETAKGVSLYNVLRCGFVHEYYGKVPYNAWMYNPAAPCGLYLDNGVYCIVVESYAKDFLSALDRLQGKLFSPPRAPDSA